MKYPPLLLKYLKMYQQDPKSKIFAPLAEAYRKIGLADEAIEICLEGLQANPAFIGGKVALARAYFDKKQFSKVRETLEPIIDHMPDNLMAQRLLADACLTLGYLQQALAAYKMIVYFNPSDEEASEVIQELETQHYKGGGLLKTEQNPEKLRKLILLQKMLNKIHEVRFRFPSA